MSEPANMPDPALSPDPSPTPSHAEETGSLKQRTVTAARWSVLSQGIRQLMSFAGTATLARFLLPEDYGLMGMALVVTNFANTFRDLGTSAAVVQRKDISDRLLSTIFWANTAFGILLMAGIAGISVPASWYYRQANITWLLLALSPVFLVAGGSAVQQALLQRNLNFLAIAKMEIFSAAASMGVAIATAAIGWGVWSLVAQTITNTIVSAFLLWRYTGWRPARVFDMGDLKSVWKYSLNLTAFSTFNYFARNADALLIGRFLGSESLGYYTMSYKIMILPLQTVSGLVGRTLFPALSRLQDNHPAFQRGYLKAIGLIAMVTFPMMLGLMAVLTPAVTVLLSAKWRPIIPLLLILCPLGMIQSILTTTGNVFLAKGRTGLLFRVGIVTSLISVGAICFGLQWKLIGVTTSILVSEMVVFVICFHYALKLIDLSVVAIFRPIWKSLVSALVMAGAVWAVSHLVGTHFGMKVNLIVSVVVGIALYAAVQFAINRDQSQDLLGMLAGKIKKKA